MNCFKSLLLVLIVALLPQSLNAKVVRVLAIGNSFSEDAIEQNLYELAIAGGDTCIEGNMYIGGCPLERHCQNMKSNAAAYRYRKIGPDGRMTQRDNTTLDYALADEPWDYVSLQQVSHFSGMFQTYQPYLNQLAAYVRGLVPGVRLLWHQTWAYEQGAVHSGFKNYNRDQMTMYRAIVDCSRKAMQAANIAIVVPSGTAIQNARTSWLGDNLTRDGYHLNLRCGRYTAACTWYEVLFGKTVVGNSYSPRGMTPQLTRIAQRAAHKAVKQPWRVSKL